MLLLVDGDDAAVAVEDDAAAGGGALVDGGDEGSCGVCVGHVALLNVIVKIGFVEAVVVVRGPTDHPKATL